MAKRRVGKASGVSALVKRAAAAKAAAMERKRKRALSLLALIERRRGRIVEDFFDIGDALRELLRDELYAALEYASFDEMLRARGLMSLSQAKKLIAVVENVPRDEALALGQERAYALVAYAAATPAPETVAALVESGADVAKGSLREIEKATREERAKVAAKRPQTAAQRERARREKAALSVARAVLRGAGVPRAALVVQGEAVLVTLPFTLLERLAAR